MQTSFSFFSIYTFLVNLSFLYSVFNIFQPEGVLKEYNTPILLNLNQGTTAHETVDVTLPQNVVAGSEHVRISVIGIDISKFK